MAVKFSEFTIGTINADLEIVGFNSATPANVQVSYTDIKTDILAGAITGTVAIGQVPFGSAANTVVGSNNLFWDNVNARLGIGTNTLTSAIKLTISGTETALSGIARGELINTTLNASANLDALVGLDISPTFSSGAFTSVNNIGIRSSVSGGTATKPTFAAQFINSTNNFGSHGVFIQTTETSDSTYPLLIQAAGTNNTFSIRGNRYLWYSGGNAYFGNFSNGSARVHVRGGASEPSLIIENSSGVSSLQVQANQNVLIGSAVDGGQRLQVYGDVFIKGSGNTSATNALLIQNSTGNTSFYVTNSGGVYTANFLAVGTDIVGQSTNLTIEPGSSNGRLILKSFATSSSSVNVNGGVTFTHNTGQDVTSLLLNQNYSPVGGTGLQTYIRINPTINQTGGATGITRGLYIIPTLTAVNDWRAIEITTGVSVFAPSSTASATLRIPSGTAPTTPVNGDVWSDGTNLFTRIGGVTKTFTLI